MQSKRQNSAIRLLTTLILAAICFAISHPSSANAGGAREALLVGISRYSDPQIGGASKAPENDVKVMKEALDKRGFHVTVLTNVQATRERIIGTLKSYPAGIDQFVLYYAGKSEVDVFNGKSWIYPSDTSATNPGTWISARELRSAVEDVPAVSRTVILDTAAAGYLINAPGHKWVCYCVSSQAHQSAAVGQYTKDDELDKFASRLEIDNRPVSAFLGRDQVGVFTHYLARGIKHGSDDETWNQLMDQVATGMRHQVGSNQAPDLTSDFADTRVFAISPVLLTRSPGTTAPPEIAETTVSTPRPAAVVAPPPVTPPDAAPPAAAPDQDKTQANARLIGLWTAADGSVDEQKAKSMTVADVSAALKAGADANAVDNNGLTVLLVAAGALRPDIAKIAIAAHADINFKNEGVGTPLVFASNIGSPEIVKMLLAAGADLTATDENGNTALAAARAPFDGKSAETISKIVALLTAAGAK